MKKAILILLSFILICTMCVGFVACDSNVPIIEGTHSIFKFALENEFSFGKVVRKESDFVVLGKETTQTFPSRYDIVFDNDTAFDKTIYQIDCVYEKYKSELYIPTADWQNWSLTDCLVGQQSVLAIRYTEDESVASMEYFETKESGDDYVVHEVYCVEKYNIAYVSSTDIWLFDICQPIRTDVRSFVLSSVIYCDGWDRAVVLCTMLCFKSEMLWFDDFIGKVTLEERENIAQYYQPIHKEIVTDWAKSKYGQEYLECWQ